MVLAVNLVGLGLLYTVSYIKSIPTNEKLFAAGKKETQVPLLTHVFLGWVGRRLGSSSVS